jgi:hypothetical protein
MSVIWEDFFLSGTWPGSFTKTWTDFTGFTDQAVTASITAQIDSAGNPGPSCDFTTTTAGLSSAFEKWRGPSATWESWGVPAGAVVTTVQITGFDTQCYARAGVTANPTIKMRLVDATTGTTVHAAGELQSASLAETVDAAWHARTAGTARTVDSGKQASTTAVKLELELTITTSSSVNSDFGFDNVALLITYAAASSGSTAFTQSLTDTVTPTDSAVRTIASARSDTATLAEESSRGPNVKPADTVTSSDSVAKTLGPRVTDQTPITDTSGGGAARIAGLAKADTVTPSDSRAATVGAKNFADTVTPSDDFSFNGARTATLADTVTFGETPVVTFRLALSDTVTPTDLETVLSEGLQLDPLDPGSLTLTPLE